MSVEKVELYRTVESIKWKDIIFKIKGMGVRETQKIGLERSTSQGEALKQHFKI